jgi:DUF971 family protein
MQLVPVDIQLVGDELAIRWSDERESYLPLQNLRLACPCAGCCGEPDALGHIDKPRVSYDAGRSFSLRSYAVIGGYALQPTWQDGHATGLYTFESLRRLGSQGQIQPVSA